MKLTYLTASACVALLCMASSAWGLEIRHVWTTDSAFDPASGEKAEVHFQLSEAADVELQIYDAREVLVRRIHKSLSAGDHAIAWDGRDPSGEVVPPEAYRYVLEATNQSGAAQVHDLSDITGGGRIRAQDVEWDSDSSTIRYVLPEPARVAIRIGLKENGPLLKTLLDWAPRQAGANADSWDGWDESDVLELGDHPNLSVFVDAYRLSENTLFVGAMPEESEFIEIPTTQRTARKGQRTEAKQMYAPWQQPVDSRQDVAIGLSLANSVSAERDGAPLVSGTVPVRFDIAPGDRQRALNRRFETVFFVDGTFVQESEVGYAPVTWQWDSSAVNPGLHYLTANFRGYEGNFGTATIKVYVADRK